MGDFEAEANNTDLGGELLSSVWMDGDATIDDCCPLCDDTEGCMGFVYYEQTCHVKGGSSLSTYENAGRISRVRSPCSGFEPTEEDQRERHLLQSGLHGRREGWHPGT